MTAALLGLATATPAHAYSQHEIAEILIDLLSIDAERSERLRTLYLNTAIEKRHSVIDDFKKDRSEWKFWNADFPRSVPSTFQRNQVYKHEAPRLALEAAEKALQTWGGDPKSLTHVISVSCTGMMAPGIEFGLISPLQLNPSINRLAINFMGCFGAFKGLSVAKAFALENPAHRVLLVCTELCSLHLQSDLTSDNLLGNSIFSDGAAAVVIGMEPRSFEKPLWNIIQHHSLCLENSTDLMSWEVSDTGFLMRLSHKVPVYIGRTIRNFIEQILLQGITIQECDWPIHPRGKSILQAIEKSLQLDRQQTQASWDVLADYGNMSSSTFLFVLDQLSKQQNQKPWAVGLAFGPGLSMEGILLRKSKEKS